MGKKSERIDDLAAEVARLRIEVTLLQENAKKTEKNATAPSVYWWNPQCPYQWYYGTTTSSGTCTT